MRHSPGARARGKEWDALVALGPKVLPLVVGKVQSKDEIFAYMLCASCCSDIVDLMINVIFDILL